MEDADLFESGFGEILANFFFGVGALAVDFHKFFAIYPELHIDFYEQGFWVPVASPTVAERCRFAEVLLIEHAFIEGVARIEVEHPRAAGFEVFGDLVNSGSEAFSGGDVVEGIEEGIGGIEGFAKFEISGVGHKIAVLREVVFGFEIGFFNHAFAKIEASELVAFFLQEFGHVSGSATYIENLFGADILVRPEQDEVIHPHTVGDALHEQIIMRGDFAE